jgi:hypothetical protein
MAQPLGDNFDANQDQEDWLREPGFLGHWLKVDNTRESRDSSGSIFQARFGESSMVKRISHVIGFDDAPFERAHRGDVVIVGAVFGGTRVLIELVRRSRFGTHCRPSCCKASPSPDSTWWTCTPARRAQNPRAGRGAPPTSSPAV